MKSRFRQWSDLRAFLAVMRAGSTLAAARGLDMAQPTVARRIAALEHALGVVLFDRDTRGFRPTQAAVALLPLAEEVERAADAFAVRAADLTRARPIRITAYMANFSPRVTEIFSAFSAAHPEVGFEFLPGVRSLDLMAGEADVALRLTYSEPHPDLICRQISLARFTFYAARSYAEAHGLPSTPEELAGHRCFSFVREDMPPIFDRFLRRYVPDAAIVQTFSEIGMLDAAVRSGQGIGVQNLRFAEDEEKAGELVRCFAPPDELTARHLLLVAPDAYRRPEVKAFVTFFAPRYAALFR